MRKSSLKYPANDDSSNGYTPSTRSSRKSSSTSNKYRPSSEKSSKKKQVNVKQLLKPKVEEEIPTLTLEERELILVENVDDVQGALIKQSLYGT